MFCLAVLVFVVLQRVTAGYGMMYNRKWGPTVNNRLGWVLMEAPSFIAMLLLWIFSPRASSPALIVMALLFEVHYFQRSFLFPMLIRGANRMPLVIIICGVVFNIINAYMIGGWLFYVSPADTYPVSWLWSPLFILGTVIFLGDKSPFRPYHQAFAPSGRQRPLHPAGWNVPLRHFRQLFRRSHRMAWLRHSYMEPRRTRLRGLDVRESRSSRKGHTPPVP